MLSIEPERGGVVDLTPTWKSMSENRRPQLPAEAGLFVVVLIWGLNFSIIKIPLEVIPPLGVNAIRFLVSVVVLGGIHLQRCRLRKVGFLDDFRRAPLRLLLLGLIGHVAYQACFILGIERTTAGNASLIIATSPLWTALIAHVLGIDRLKLFGWVGLVVSLAGALLVISPDPDGPGNVSGELLILAGTFAWATFTVFSRPLLNEGMSPLGLAFFSIAVIYPVLFLLGLPDLGTVNWTDIGSLEVLALLYSGGLSTGISYVLWNTAVRKAGPSRTAAFSNLVPFVGVTGGALLLLEPVGLSQVLGGLLIVSGLVMMRRGDRVVLS